MNSNKTESHSGCPTVGHEGLKYLSSLAPWKGKGGFTLDKMRALMAELGNPQDTYHSVHIAGTNGKGSVTVALAAMAGAAGFRTGMTISPHLGTMNERIVIDGAPITDELLDIQATKVAEAQERLNIELSFFEGITACAFLAFHAVGVDWAILEVGLGGRLDATNVVRSPRACVIVSIDFDHQDILGPTLECIASEKAGIIKPRAPVYVGSVSKEARDVIYARARSLDAPIYFVGQDFSWNTGNVPGAYIFDSEHVHELEFATQLKGQHQGHNMSIAIAAGLGVGFSPGQCVSGVANCFWPGRLELLEMEAGRVLIDCAHNPAGINSLVKYLADKQFRANPMVFGALGTKNWQEMVDRLLPHATSWLLVKPDSSNAVESSLVKEYLSGLGVSAVTVAQNLDDAVRQIRAGGDDTVVAGSIYMVGPVRTRLAGSDCRYWQSSSTRSTSMNR